MTTRTFKQLGLAYGPAPVAITVRVDGVKVFDTAVPALNLAGVPPLVEATTELLFSWEREVSTRGIQRLEVTVQGGSVRLESLVANHILVHSPWSSPSMLPGGAQQWGGFYHCPTEHGLLCDSKSNVRINDVEQLRTVTADTLGEWYYVIGDGETLTCDVLTYPGVELYAWDPTKIYVQQALVLHHDVWYFAKQNVPMGTDITSTSYWAALPVPEWSATRSWGAGTTVTHEGRLFTSRFAVPRDIAILDQNYWNRYDDDLATLGNYGLDDWIELRQDP